MQKEDSTLIKFEFADNDAHKPACSHKCHKGKVRETFIKMSNEAMEVLVYSYLRYKHNSVQLPPPKDEPVGEVEGDSGR